MNMFSILELITNLDDNWVIQACYQNLKFQYQTK